MENNDLNGLINYFLVWLDDWKLLKHFISYFWSGVGAEKTSYKKFLQLWIWNQGKLGQVNPANFGVDWTSDVAFTLMELINFQ